MAEVISGRAPQIETFEGRTPSLGADVFIHWSAAVIGAVTLGDQVNLWPQVTLRGDEGPISIGAGTNIQDGSTIHMTGGISTVSIGARCTVGHQCLLHGCEIGYANTTSPPLAGDVGVPTFPTLVSATSALATLVTATVTTRGSSCAHTQP